MQTHLAGICGSDLALVAGRASGYFDDWVSWPFVPGHEIVGELDDGRRVVVEPVLGHAARGARLPFPDARPGDGDDYAHLVTGPLEPGIQIGFCCSTGGGWAPWFWAHRSQLHELDDTVADERAVLIEPFAAGTHAALTAVRHLSGLDAPVLAVIGAGTMGLAAIAALRRHLPPAARIVVAARYDHQRHLATELGADVAVGEDDLPRSVRRETGCHLIGDHLSSGAHATIDAVGSHATIADALRITRPRGRVVLLGMPAEVTVDMSGLWHREIQLVGAYTYGTERMPDGGHASTFDLARQIVDDVRAERLLSAVYPLDDHVEAIHHAAAAGSRGAVKIAFDPRRT